jgi:hypothetical protein
MEAKRFDALTCVSRREERRRGQAMKKKTNRSSSAKRHPRVLVAMAWHEVDHMVGIARYAREKGWILHKLFQINLERSMEPIEKGWAVANEGTEYQALSKPVVCMSTHFHSAQESWQML